MATKYSNNKYVVLAIKHETKPSLL